MKNGEKRNTKVNRYSRKGKWTVEEEAYADALIDHFKLGFVVNTVSAQVKSLRMYLAAALDCDPMRVTKKYAKTSQIGKISFEEGHLSSNQKTKMQTDLANLKARWELSMQQATALSAASCKRKAAEATSCSGISSCSRPKYLVPRECGSAGLDGDNVRHGIVVSETALKRQKNNPAGTDTLQGPCTTTTGGEPIDEFSCSTPSMTSYVGDCYENHPMLNQQNPFQERHTLDVDFTRLEKFWQADDVFKAADEERFMLRRFGLGMILQQRSSIVKAEHFLPYSQLRSHC